MDITVKIKNVYGNETAYPVCDKAKAFAAIANQKTLTGATLREIERLGYTIIIAQHDRYSVR